MNKRYTTIEWVMAVLAVVAVVVSLLAVAKPYAEWVERNHPEWLSE